jgi:outer membrane protein insertion porin family
MGCGPGMLAGARDGLRFGALAVAALLSAAPLALHAQTPGQGFPATSPSTDDAATATTGTTPAVVYPQAANDVGPANANGNAGQAVTNSRNELPVQALTHNLSEYAGQRVTAIHYEGVVFASNDQLIARLDQRIGDKLDPAKVSNAARELFATGRYRNISVRVEPAAGGLTLIFAGIPTYYVGRIQVNGVKQERLASLLQFGTRLEPGTPFTDAEVTAATTDVEQVLAQNGYYEPTIAVKVDQDAVNQQVNVTFTVAIGALARVGVVTLAGTDVGIKLEDFREKGKIKAGTKVGRETITDALSNLRNYFQKKDRLEATVSLRSSTYDSVKKTLNYNFDVDQGPVVTVKVEGAKFSKSRLHLLVPVFQEGTVDNDLLNEGTHNMKDYLQQAGFFDAQVAVQVLDPRPDLRTVLYTVEKGDKHKVVSVTIKGNKYFSTDLLKENLHVQKADAFLRSGRYSQQLVKTDQSSIQDLYRANGFRNAKVTTKVVDSGDQHQLAKGQRARITVVFTIDEGTQDRFGTVAFKGLDQSREKEIKSLTAAREGQPFSLVTLSGDRDAILANLLSNGFDQARVEVMQNVDKTDPSKVDVSYVATEGNQVFVSKIVESGIGHTKPKVVNDQLTIHPGDPLDQSAVLQTQRNLYDLALFNEVNVAVQNPNGEAELKNVLVQLTESKRWDVTYGFGFEVQTGVPGCGAYCTQQGTTKAQQGKAGVSPRVLIEVSRINLFGRQDSLTAHGTYGLLEKVATLTFQNPQFYGSRKFSLQVSGGYSNVQDISTFKSSTLSGDVRLTQKAARKDTFIYNFQYRRVKVDPNSLAISSNLIPLLSQPVRVGGPGITWLHETRSPSPLDAVKGSYTSVQSFFASSVFGSQTDFERTDATNSTYYQFGKKQKYVFARNTRLGLIGSYGTNPSLPVSGNLDNSPCSPGLASINASCNSVPLPERLYAGGATSDRGFPINGAGPRDLQTGFPVGGSAAFINQFELRLPPPVLPYVGDSLSFVIFHDMGNVFYHVGDVFPSFLRFKQPHQETCRVVTGVTYGKCDFNYFSHALGLGARYKTPVGPIRADFSYNLNPPIYPVIPQQSSPGVYLNNLKPYVGQGNHFNFFFSIGQSF